MAVNTRSKRSAALRFGSVGRAGTRPPDGLISAFDRAALLGCYSSAAAEYGDPVDGWTYLNQPNTWTYSLSPQIFEVH